MNLFRWIFISFSIVLWWSCKPQQTANANIPDRPLKGTEWVLTQMDTLHKPSSPSGDVLFIHLVPGGEVLHGFDGCNRLNGKYKAVEEEKQLAFTDFFGTLEACPDTKTPQRFTALLASCDRYVVKGNMLYLYKGKKIILEFTAR